MLPELLGYDSPAALAKAMGLDPNTVRKAMQGPSKPSFDTLEAITKKHPKLSPDWLLLGTGPMLRDGRALTPAARPTADPSDPPAPSRPGLPVPGTATPAEADFVGRLIERLEKELADAKAREEQQGRLIQTLLGKSPASAYAAIPSEPRQQIAGFRTTAQAREGKVVAMYPAPLKQVA